MSLKIRNLNFKKNYYNYNLDTKNHSKVAFVYKDKKIYKSLINIMTGKKNNFQGDILINDKSIRFKMQKDKQIAKITSRALNIRFLPTKLLLMKKFFLDFKFLSNSYKKYINQKYTYKIFQKSFDNLTLKKTLNKIDNSFKKTFRSISFISNNSISDFLNIYESINEKKANQLFEDFEDNKYLKKSIYNLLNQKEELFILERKLILQQALWDNFYSFKEIDNVCFCSSKTNIKMFKKEELKYKYYLDLLVQKNLKKIKSNILLLRFNIAKKRFKIKKYKKSVKKALFHEFQDDQKSNVNSYIQNKIRKQLIKRSELLSLYKTVEVEKFISEQNSLISNIIPDEFNNAQRYIVNVIHNYHKKLLKNELDFIDSRECEHKSRELFQNIHSVTNQIYNKASNIMSDFNIKISFLKLTKNLEDFNKLKISIINNFLFNKKIFILNNIVKVLSKKDLFELNELINKILIRNPNLLFIFATDNAYQIAEYCDSTYYIGKNSYYETTYGKDSKFYKGMLSLERYKQNHEVNIFYKVKYNSNKNTINFNNNNIFLNKNIDYNEQELVLVLHPSRLSFSYDYTINESVSWDMKGELEKYNKKSKYKKFYNKDLTLYIDKYINFKNNNDNLYIQKNGIFLYHPKTGELIYSE